jgi:hypothetical protein
MKATLFLLCKFVVLWKYVYLVSDIFPQFTLYLVKEELRVLVSLHPGTDLLSFAFSFFSFLFCDAGSQPSLAKWTGTPTFHFLLLLPLETWATCALGDSCESALGNPHSKKWGLHYPYRWRDKILKYITLHTMERDSRERERNTSTCDNMGKS